MANQRKKKGRSLRTHAIAKGMNTVEFFLYLIDSKGGCPFSGKKPKCEQCIILREAGTRCTPPSAYEAAKRVLDRDYALEYFEFVLKNVMRNKEDTWKIQEFTVTIAITIYE